MRFFLTFFYRSTLLIPDESQTEQIVENFDSPLDEIRRNAEL